MDKDVVKVLVSEIEAAFAWRLRAESDAAIKMLDANDALRAVAELIAAAQDIRTNGLGTASGKRLDAALAACKPEGA